MRVNNQAFIIIITLLCRGLFASEQPLKLPLTYEFYLAESTSAKCKRVGGELSSNKQALAEQMAKRNACFAGKILITNQQLVAQNPECQPMHKEYYASGANCDAVNNHMKLSVQKITQLIKENKECEIGEVLVTDRDFLGQYPNCYSQVSEAIKPSKE